MLALTATGSGPIRDEIVERLRLDQPLLLSHGFDRPGLRLEVVRHEEAAEKQRVVVVTSAFGMGIDKPAWS
ncbi:hypothetical protein AX769_11200 [Frondihabitans sp. PAMC 28766]|uniref:hypothetical protein n=1 Tax=Frondihabitans sp. PAMC 28766 TaxID=1795630 RepID=UPI00078D66F5|nr:hypothetical protein [Frondihabitans sp. PAMC 28766]AMM20601.1 hypothetical protein AX769_11200 [Frondihabitans sp. PAMC 28766]